MRLLYEKRRRHPDGLLQAKACASDGACLFCEDPLPPSKTKPRVICGRRGCTLAYHRAWLRDRKFARRAA